MPLGTIRNELRYATTAGTDIYMCKVCGGGGVGT